MKTHVLPVPPYETVTKYSLCRWQLEIYRFHKETFLYLSLNLYEFIMDFILNLFYVKNTKFILQILIVVGNSDE